MTAEDFNGEGSPQEGYFYATHIADFKGATVRTSTHPDKWIPLDGDGEKGDLLILLGEEKPSMEWYEVKGANGQTVRYDLTGIGAAATIASVKKTAVKKSTAKKSSK